MNLRRRHEASYVAFRERETATCIRRGSGFCRMRQIDLRARMRRVSTAPVPLITVALQRPHELAPCTLPQWEELIHQARRTNLLSRVAQSLTELSLLRSVPPAPRANLEAALVVAAAQVEAVEREVAFLRTALATVDVDLVLLKGAAYLIAGLPAARGRVFSDVDILVPFTKLAEVEAALMLHGWTTTHHNAYDQRYYRQWMHELPPLRHNARTTVLDVHHAILPVTARLKPESAKLLAASRPIGGDDRLRVLSPADMVLHSATHLFHNDDLSQGLRDLADLDSLLRHFGQEPGFWEELPSRATDLDLARPLYYGLRYASRFLGTPVPVEARRRADTGQPSRLSVRLMDALYDYALRPVAARDGGLVTPLSRRALYVRAHWLRMPPHLLAWHLSVKALRREEEPAK